MKFLNFTRCLEHYIQNVYTTGEKKASPGLKWTRLNPALFCKCLINFIFNPDTLAIIEKYLGSDYSLVYISFIPIYFLLFFFSNTSFSSLFYFFIPIYDIFFHHFLIFYILYFFILILFFIFSPYILLSNTFVLKGLYSSSEC